MKINGADKLIGALKTSANLDDVKKTVKLNTSELNNKAQRRAPVDTGHLKRSIGLELTDNDMTGKVEAKADYSGYVNYGTRYQSAQPFMTSSFREVEKQFIRDMQRLMK